MQAKGQVSFDLIFAIIAVIVFLQFMVSFVDNLTESQNFVGIQQQERLIALKVRSAFAACDIADANTGQTNTKILFTLPKINEVGVLTGTADCTVTAAGNPTVLTISYSSPTSGMIVYSTRITGLAQNFSKKCGDEILINC